MQPEYYEWVVELLLDISEYDKAFKWCGRVRSRYKEELITYKCYFRYYYGIGDGEMFLSTLEELKKVDITIDSDTLELLEHLVRNRQVYLMGVINAFQSILILFLYTFIVVIIPSLIFGKKVCKQKIC